ncbi:NRDE family protein [Zunongwangia sp. HGR-M22]|uniref:NRDE family protein n=1 Tax=Zunongwangia sp. HGR-M22 TaxID=3015168 RepID=UPI0022DE05A3|nr:NRDE family protein [Zunongwangia sp. HGR-M22]WBL26523.1 NRDE family protein [Zunongwangia sp. HGR-M22]
MCTVSIFPKGKHSDSFILSFNRDEAIERETLPPKKENVNGCEMIFPKDAVAGGTWLGVSAHKRLIGIMNGEFKAHKRNPPYRKSRGVVVKEFLAMEDVKMYAENYDFEGIEPFTMLCVDWSSDLTITEMVWDAKQLHIKNVHLKPQIWSSSPLYDSAMKKNRTEWFDEFKKETKISAESIWDFHHNAGVGDATIDLIVDRGFLKTQSISQIEISKKRKQFKYEELATGSLKIINLQDLV